MKKSFSLIEVLIFVSILSVFLVIAAGIITVSMRQNTVKVDMLKATHYNEQLLDWIRTEKEKGWNTFVVKGETNPQGNGLLYCFLDDTWSAWPSSVTTKADCDYTLNNMYRRYVTLTTDNNTLPTQVTVSIYTDWQDAGNPYSTRLDSLFTVWEQ